jgi:dUTP pyrophosphatase
MFQSTSPKILAGKTKVENVQLEAPIPAHKAFTVRVGDRIAQLVVQEVLCADFVAADSLPESQRGETGHGSTGGFGPAAGQDSSQ